MLFPAFSAFTDSETAWRTVCIVPAVISFVTGIVILRISDDCPKGNYSELKKHGNFPQNLTVASSFTKASMNLNTWLLFVQYACCFGVELTMNNAAALYFRDEFGQSTEAASAIAAIFGWLNLFARGLGGFASDACNYHWGMRGRIWIQTICLLFEGIMVFIFSGTSTLAGSVISLVAFSLFVQAAEGTSYAIIPYVDPPNTGSVAGIVGAGGNVGAVSFGFGFRQLNYHDAFNIMGGSILFSCALSIFINIKGYSAMFWGRDRRVDKETGEILRGGAKVQRSDEHIGQTLNTPLA